MTRSLRIGLLLTIVFNVPLAVFLIARPGSVYVFTSVGDIAEIVGPLAGLIWFGVALARERGLGQARSGPLLVAAGVLFFVIGDIIWAYYEVLLRREVPFPSAADVAYLAMYPLVAAGILRLPHRPMSPLFRAMVMLDASLITGAVATFSWFFVLGPTIQGSYESDFSRLLGSAYPAADLVLVAALFLVTVQSVGVASRLSTTLLGIGLAAIIMADTAFDVLTLHGVYGSGGISDIGWSMGYMVLPLGALELARSSRKAETPTSTSAVLPVWSVFLPYLLLVAVVGLMVFVARYDQSNALDAGVYAGGGTLLGLALLRQLVVVLENQRLIRKQMQAEEALRESEAALRHLALHDGLTGLPNRRLLRDRLERMVALTSRRGKSFALMLIDLDHFKAVNDHYGHLGGDMLLKHVAKRLQTEVRASDTVARLAGDEFAILLPDIAYDDAEKLAAVLAQSIRLPFALEGPVVTIGGSVGVALFPLHAQDADSLLRCADDAMYVAKRSGLGSLMYEAEEPEENVLNAG